MSTAVARQADPAGLSVAFLESVRRRDRVAALEAALAGLDADRVATLDEAARRAFWLNVYNASTQRALRAVPEAYENRRRFFAADRVEVAGRRLSLDDIEHGMLRRSRPKWFLGYVTHPFPGRFERRLRVDRVDPRIHFALNCGAASCPPIAAYDPASLDADLETAARGYLESTVEYRPEAGRAVLPRLFLWFRGDFGGRSGILSLLREHGLLPADARPWLTHHGFDWSLDPGDFRGDD